MTADHVHRIDPGPLASGATVGPRDRLLGETVARRIQHEIIAAGWPVGTILGSEADLLTRYDVSRSVLREAARLLEHLGVARMRRGPGGGLVVSQPDPSAVVAAVLAYVTYEQISLDEVLAVRRPIEETSARLAAQRRTDDDVARISTQLSNAVPDFSHEFDFHSALARMTGNPAVELFVEILNRVTAQFAAAEQRVSRARIQAGVRQREHIHRRIVVAVSDGDAEAAVRRMERHVEATTEFLSERQRHQTLGLADVVSNGNARGPLAPTIARQIYSEVIAKGWPVGDLLGSEAELLARYRVSRSVFRESLRLLEFNGVVTTRRGLGGGIFVSRPDVGATVEAMASYIESRGITPEQLFEVRQAIELAAVDLAATRIDADGERQLEATIEAENRGDLRVLAQALHLRIAEITGNRILHLFLHALTLLAEAHTLGPTEQTVTEAEALENVQRIHRAIVDAIVSGDMALARRRMERHLVALVPYQH